MSAFKPRAITAMIRSWQLPVVLSMGCIAMAVLLMISADKRAEREAIERMPAGERQALYERTQHTLEGSCAPQNMPRGLNDFCRGQAELISQFPECDASCQSLANLHAPKPTR